MRAIVRLGLNRQEADVLGVKDAYAGLARSARRLGSGQLRLASFIDAIDTHGRLLGFDTSAGLRATAGADTIEQCLENLTHRAAQETP